MKGTSTNQLFEYNGIQLFRMLVSGSTLASISDVRNHTLSDTSSGDDIKFYDLQDTIKGFSKLPQNWDTYNADSINYQAIDGALKVLSQLKKDDIFSKGIEINVFPMRTGGIQFEFDAYDLCAELEIGVNGETSFLLFDEDANLVDNAPMQIYELSELAGLLDQSVYVAG